MLLQLLPHVLRQVTRFSVQGLLATLGVTIGVANIILLVSITDLGRQQTVSLVNDFGANVLIISPFLEQDSGPMGAAGMAMLSAHMPDEVREVIADAPEISDVAAVMFQPAHLSNGEESVFTSVLGVTPAFTILRGRNVANGRWLEDADLTKRKPVICLGETVREALFGETAALGQQVEIKGEQFTVVGLMEFGGRIGLEDLDNRVFIPLDTAQRIFDFDGIHGMFVRYGSDVEEDQAVAAVWDSLAQLVSDDEVVEETYSVLTMQETRKLLASTLDIFRLVLGGVSSIALIVAGLGIMNVMLIRVMERRHEIGVRRAVGARAKDIVMQFLVEGIVQALGGGILGAALGVAGVHIYCAYAEWTAYVNPTTVLLAVTFGLLIGVASGVYPAVRAAKLDPLETLRRT